MGKVNAHKAKFYCESCGSEVPQNAKFCNTCGKFFTFVRCPNCHFTGDSKKFTLGCPKCGYAVKPYGNLEGIKRGRSGSSLFGTAQAKTSGGDSSLPVWIYVVTIAALVAVVFGLYSCL